jgi:hypothetical protein
MSKRELLIVGGIFAFFIGVRLVTSVHDRVTEVRRCAEANTRGMVVDPSCGKRKASPVLLAAAGWAGTLTVPLVLSIIAVAIDRRNAKARRP